MTDPARKTMVQFLIDWPENVVHPMFRAGEVAEGTVYFNARAGRYYDLYIEGRGRVGPPVTLQSYAIDPTEADEEFEKALGYKGAPSSWVWRYMPVDVWRVLSPIEQLAYLDIGDA